MGNGPTAARRRQAIARSLAKVCSWSGVIVFTSTKGEAYFWCERNLIQFRRLMQR
jgi:hypothetical protein